MSTKNYSLVVSISLWDNGFGKFGDFSNLKILILPNYLFLIFNND